MLEALRGARRQMILILYKDVETLKLTTMNNHPDGKIYYGRELVRCGLRGVDGTFFFTKHSGFSQGSQLT